MFNFFNKKKDVVYKPQIREKHDWQLIGRNYAAPVRDLGGVALDKLPMSIVQKMSLGVTTYIWECLLTGDIKTEEILGSASDTLQEILDRANRYGQQVVKDDAGRSYLVDKYLHPSEITSLPVRKV